MLVFRRAFMLLVLSGLFLLHACGPGEVSDNVVTAPVITAQPASATSAGTSATVMKVVATGGGLRYQWHLDGTAIAGATASNYSANTAGVYTVVVSNTTGTVTSSGATLTISMDPVIRQQPQSATITSGKNTVLSVVATGMGLTYQWYRDSTAVVGASNASFTASAAGTYYVVVSSTRSGAKSVTSSNAIISLSTASVAPAIATSPANAVAAIGDATSFGVSASGTDLKYQWYKDGVLLTSATSARYAIDPVASVDAGSYYVVVSNTLGYVASAPANLSVTTTNSGDNKAVVVAAANAFLATLTSSQKVVASSTLDSSTVLFSNAQANAVAWTALVGGHHGLRLSSTNLSIAQLNAANTLIAAALSTTGATQMSELRLSDDVVGNVMPGTGANASLYSVAFIGQPSLTQPWILQLSGRQLTHNISFNTSQTSATPMYMSAQPPNWTYSTSGSYVLNNASVGTQHAPMESQRLAVSALATSLLSSTSTASSPKLPVNPGDLVFGPTSLGDTRFKALPYPTGTTGRGVIGSSLNASQLAALKSLLSAYVKTQSADTAEALLTAYQSDAALAATYVGYANGTGGTLDFSPYPNGSALPLASANSYLRIDGPRVWIEFLVKSDTTLTGTLANTVFYQTVWRDKLADYGGQY